MGGDTIHQLGAFPPLLACGFCKSPALQLVRSACKHIYCKACFEVCCGAEATIPCGICGKQLGSKTTADPQLEMLLRLTYPEHYVASDNEPRDQHANMVRCMKFMFDSIDTLCHARLNTIPRMRGNINERAEAFFGTTRKYNLIHVDCPWDYSNQHFNGGIKSRYSSMKDEELYALPIEGLCKEDAALFMWTTMPKLDIALNTIYAWGFRYTTCFFAWTKVYPKKHELCAATGCYTRPNTELCLLGIRGDISKYRQRKTCITNAIVTRPEVNPLLSDMPGHEDLGKARLFGFHEREEIEYVEASPLFTVRGEHSQKPEEGYEKILRVFGDLPRIDVFSRKKRMGWDAFGDQTDTFTPDPNYDEAADKEIKSKQDANYEFCRKVVSEYNDMWNSRDASPEIMVVDGWDTPTLVPPQMEVEGWV